MTALQKYGKACQELAKEFIIHKIGIEEWEERAEYDKDRVSKLNLDEYFIGSTDCDYGLFSDGSDFYTWSITDMYIILSKGIPYDIATEHFDWTMGDSRFGNEKPDAWCNLEHYWIRRAPSSEMSAQDFQRKLERMHHLDRASRLTDEFVAETEKQMQFLRDKFEEDMKEYTTNK